MRVVVGRVGRAHGLRGEVAVEPRTDEPERRFSPGHRLLVDDRPGGLVVECVRWHSGRLLVAFEGIPDRSAAEELRGLLLEVEREAGERPEGPDEYYDSELEGLDAMSVTGERLGVVSEVLHLPGQDLLVIAREGASEALVPFVEAMVPEVDVAARRVVIDPPEGLLDG